MTAAGRPLDARDEAVMAAVAARLARVDAELDRLPQRRPIRSDAPHLHVVRGRTMPRQHGVPAREGPRRIARWRAEVALAAAVVVLVAFAAGRSTGQLQPLTGAGASPTPSASGTPPSEPVEPTPTPAASTLGPPGRPPLGTPSTAPGDPSLDGLRAAMAIVGWPCAVTVRVAHDPIAPGLVAKLDAVGRLPDGFIPGDLDPLWSGSDPDAAAHAFKGRRLVTMPDGGVWILRQAASGPALVELVVQRAPSGTLLWRAADVAWPLVCARAAADPKLLLAGHSGDDWPAGQVIDIAVVRVGQAAPGTDLER